MGMNGALCLENVFRKMIMSKVVCVWGCGSVYVFVNGMFKIVMILIVFLSVFKFYFRIRMKFMSQDID